MKAKDYLMRMATMNADITADIEELETLKALAEKTTCAIGDERVQTSTNLHKMEDYTVRILELKDKIPKDLVVYLDYKKQARKLIRENCDADCITLLRKRYFQNKKWEEVALEMNYNFCWVSGRLHQKALAQLQKALDREEANGNAI